MKTLTRSPASRASAPATLRSKLLVSIAVFAGTLGLMEFSVRALDRIQHGTWFYHPGDRACYMNHPMLGQIPRGGSKLVDQGHVIQINSLGYRGDPISLEKNSGTIRIACVGGSTTFDPQVTRDDLAWPAQLSTLLRGRHGVSNVEVVNASLQENSLSRSLIDLALRTVDLQPDWVVCYAGINDLACLDLPENQIGQWQHAEVRIEEQPVWKRFFSCSALYRRMTEHVRHARQLKYGNREGRYIERHDQPDPRGIAAFERNLRTLVGICRVHGIRLALVTVRTAYAPMQPLDVQAALAQSDLMNHPTLSLAGHYRGYDAINAIIRKVAATYRLPLIDQATILPSGEMHFADSVHFNDAGSAALAFLVADQIAPYIKPKPVELAISPAPAVQTALTSPQE